MENKNSKALAQNHILAPRKILNSENYMELIFTNYIILDSYKLYSLSLFCIFILSCNHFFNNTSRLYSFHALVLGSYDLNSSFYFS